MKKYLPMLALVLLAGTACASQDGEVTAEAVGDNRPSAATSDAAAEEESTEEPTEEPTEEAEAGPIKFGETFTYEDGVSITVSVPKPYKPSEVAAFEERPAYLVFDVTVVNGSQKNYDPSLISQTVQSANAEADPIYDTDAAGNDIGSSPSTTLLPGREAKYKIAYGVLDPKDLVLEITPGFEYDAAIYTL